MFETIGVLCGGTALAVLAVLTVVPAVAILFLWAGGYIWDKDDMRNRQIAKELKDNPDWYDKMCRQPKRK